MSKFEVGKTYQTRSICDSECIFKARIVKRTANSVWIVTGDIDHSGERKKIYTSYDGKEMIYPQGQYSMAPAITA